MVSRSAGKKVRWVEICSLCGWIDAVALDGWAEAAIKENLSKQAQRIAIASETEPFAFVQATGQDLTLREILFQALGAASVSWVGGTGSLEFDGMRAKTIAIALQAEVDRALAIAGREAVNPWGELVYELYALACNSRALDPAQTIDWQAAFERCKARFHELLPDDQVGSGGEQVGETAG